MKQLRVIAGSLRGRTLTAPKGQVTRPSHARLKETLFNILTHTYGHFVQGGWVLDLFAGSGAIGIEALSRGAERAVFVESARPALKALRDNIHHLNLEHKAVVLPIDVKKLAALSELTPPAFIYLDPPYGLGLENIALSRLLAQKWVGEGSLIVVEQSIDADPLPVSLNLDCIDQRCIGASSLRFYRLKSSP